MSTLGLFQITLIVATFLCTMASGLLFTFAIVVMPGINSLSDREFIRAFQVMDGVIQNNQPIFLLVWVGSIVALLVSVGLGISQLDGARRLMLIFGTLIYLIGVQFPTVMINVPLNNKLQTLDVDAMSETEQNSARTKFEPRWNSWNSIRTILASVVSALLITLLLIL